MATTRILVRTRPSGPATPSSWFSNLYNSPIMKLRCMSKVEFNGEREMRKSGERKPAVAAKAAAAATTSENAVTWKTERNGGVDLAFLLANIVKAAVVKRLKVVTKPRPWRLHVQMFIERVIIDCRFFTMFAVAGSLLGSVLCFVEGCFMILESYFKYFHTLSQGPDQGHVVQLLIEAIDMFLVGTAMLIFGVGLHVMFVGSRNLHAKGSQLPGSNLFGLFYLKKLPSWVGMQSITQAKSKIGHALMMILQVGVLEKFKSTPLVTGLDLACFAGAVFVSSACIFLLSRLAVGGTTVD